MENIEDEAERQTTLRRLKRKCEERVRLKIMVLTKKKLHVSIALHLNHAQLKKGSSAGIYPSGEENQSSDAAILHIRLLLLKQLYRGLYHVTQKIGAQNRDS